MHETADGTRTGPCQRASHRQWIDLDANSRTNHSRQGRPGIGQTSMIDSANDRSSTVSRDDKTLSARKTFQASLHTFSLHDGEGAERRQSENSSALGLGLRQNCRIAFHRGSHDIVIREGGLNQNSTLPAPRSNEARRSNEKSHRLLVCLEPRRQEFPVEIEERHDIGAMYSVKSRARADEDVVGCLIHDVA